MSWEALEWAGRQRTRASSTQIVLYVLANASDPQGIAMGWWTGEEHWWKYLMDRTRLARGTLFKVMGELEKLGALALEWRHPEGGGKRRAIVKLNYGCMIDQGAEGEKDSTSETISDAPSIAENESTSETQIESTSETEESQKVHEDDSIESTSETRKNPYKDSRSPPTPLRGDWPHEESWKKFKAAWIEPILHDRLCREIWGKLTELQRENATLAAAGLHRHRQGQRRPPPLCNAQKLLREEGSWPAYIALVSGAPSPGTNTLFEPGSVTARAVLTLARIFNHRPLILGDGRVVHLGEISPRLLAMAQGPTAVDEWLTFDRKSKNFWSWREFANEVFPGKTSASLSEILAPWPWPPSTEGKIYTQDSTGPPDRVEGTLCTGEDMDVAARG